VTFILNILHREMSILAADRKAIAGSPVTVSPETSTVYDYKKITLHASRSLALGIAGNTQDHYYAPTLYPNASIDDVIWKIRKHMEGFLQVHDRSGLSTLTSFMVNEGIVSFFDQEAGSYFSNTFLFSPVCNQNRLYRAKDEVQIFTAGSGSKSYEKAVGKEAINSFIASTKESCTPESCILWIQDVYRKVSAYDEDSGPEAMLVVSTKSNPKFHERC
jgi:hypothetical protein